MTDNVIEVDFEFCGHPVSLALTQPETERAIRALFNTGDDWDEIVACTLEGEMVNHMRKYGKTPRLAMMLPDAHHVARIKRALHETGEGVA
jgi:hypothetical protein